jgi:hypothetical protein
MASLKDRLREARMNRDALQKKAIPLLAFYGRSPDFECRRNEFYADLAKAFAGKKKVDEKGYEPKAGRDGRRAEIAAIGKDKAVPVITNIAPLEYLASKMLLQTKRDSHGAGYRRLSAGQRLRSICEGAAISGLKAANLEGSSGGGMPGRLPGEYKMDCIRWLGELRGANEIFGLVRSPFSLVEDVVYHDKWVWENVRADRRERLMLKLHKELDRLSVKFRMMTTRDFNARWYPARPTEEHQE